MDNLQTFVERLALNGSFAIAQETLFQVSDMVGSTESYLQGGNRRFPLVPSGTLSQFEAFERSRLEDAIFDYQREYVAVALQQEIRSRLEVRNDANITSALRFILSEVLPLMIDTAAELGELIGVPDKGAKTGKQVIDEIVAAAAPTPLKGNGDRKTEIANLRSKLEASLPSGDIRSLLPAPKGIEKKRKEANPDAKQETDGASLLGKLLGGNPVYVSQGLVFRLARTDAKTDAQLPFCITVNGENYLPLPVLKVPELESNYRKALTASFAREAISLFDEQFTRAAVEVTSPDAFGVFAARNEFRYGNLGYVRKRDGFYVYWEVPKFAMQNPLKPNVYHPFPASKIAVFVNSDGGKMYASNADVIDAMVHPFLNNWETGFQHICILSQGQFGRTAMDIVRKLSTAINAFTNGLTMESIDVHGARSEDARYFGQPLRSSLDHAGRLSRQDAVERGYWITNEWILDSGSKSLEAKHDGRQG